MKLGRSWRAGLALGLAATALLGGCSRRKQAEINPITPSFSVNRTRAPLGSAVEVTYTWALDPSAKKLVPQHPPASRRHPLPVLYPGLRKLLVIQQPRAT